MGGFSIWHWLIVLVVVVIVFGAGKLPRVATDLAQGIKNFKKGMQDPEQAKNDPPPPAGHINAQNGAGSEQKPVADKVSS